MALKAQLTGHIEEPKNTNRRINQQTANIGCGIARLALQQAVERIADIEDVIEEISDARLGRQRTAAS